MNRNPHQSVRERIQQIASQHQNYQPPKPNKPNVQSDDPSKSPYAVDGYYSKLDQQRQNHLKLFNQPAKTCSLCGYPMDWQGHKPTEWEQKWSTHEVCRDKAHQLLDRHAGITRERRMFARRRKPINGGE
jgi:hypothetical protein